MAQAAQVIGNGGLPALALTKPSKAELKRRKTALLGSKTGMMLGALHGQLADNRRAIRDGKVSMGITPQELDRTLSEIQDVLVLIRDAYVDERCPR